MGEVVSGAPAASLLPAAGERVAQSGEAVGSAGDPVAVKAVGWTPRTAEFRDRVRALFGQGLSCKQAAQQLGVTKSVVTGVKHRMGLSVPTERHQYTPEEDARMRALVDAGRTNAEIATEIRGGPQFAEHISHRLVTIGAQRPVAGKPRLPGQPGYTKDQLARTIELATSRWAVSAIAENVGISERQVRRIMEKEGIERRAVTVRPNAAPAVTVAEYVEWGWSRIITWWRENAPAKDARRWPKIGEVNDLRRARNERSIAVLPGKFTANFRSRAWH